MALMAAALLISTLSVDMLVYDEGNVYSCPVDSMEDTLARDYEYEKGDDEGKAWQLDPISHVQFEDMFYDPMECRPFY